MDIVADAKAAAVLKEAAIAEDRAATIAEEAAVIEDRAATADTQHTANESDAVEEATAAAETEGTPSLLSNMLQAGAASSAADPVNNNGNSGEDDDVEVVERHTIPPPAKFRAAAWRHFSLPHPFHHKDIAQDSAICNLCPKNSTQAVVKRSGGGTTGLNRHLERHHLNEWDELNETKASNSNSSGKGKQSLIKNFGEPILSNEDRKKQFRMAAATYSVVEATPFIEFTKPTFRKLFEPLNKDAPKIVNIGVDSVRTKVMELGRIVKEATKREVKEHRVSWTSDHWTGADDVTYTTTTAHYIDEESWLLKALCIDFKAFEGSTTGARIYADAKDVMDRYGLDTSTIVFETIGITDSAGNMGVLGDYLRKNGQEHGYCVDHVFHLNAKLAFNRK
jgi:hypothetical protein